ncbi:MULTISPECIES: hypothetical protein [Streptomycetaceae]|uniref:Uncharacterized protein n=1 Tax=Streptantibioticus cattleyicolor (strain ATCC 35852 / DSM 46488 / JCM 4925 / NBRC 14057 / NRRL 8057) TaxID=1003195 RepID=F8K0N1_STREN|nr:MULTISPECIES: hypothetical protein [Streptomycetaceae]AEW94588.1 hypothetical protein SCATT_22170 [Streptantibioticus cattleyicolor NRRL 8057 = DSM 46488]MYS59226.1 hypothetical protein [Streptomyces sp. SID5468]CCB74945.1 protein of unknown function [Streptantibioticus cattleyicolor NRRL 8057 = DSM 46488]
MSQTNDSTTYQISISAGPADGGMLNFTAQNGANDAFVLALTAAIKGVSWPAGETPLSINVTKLQAANTASTADFTVTPPVFS